MGRDAIPYCHQLRLEILMKKQLLISSLVSFAAVAVSAQVVVKFDFDETSGTQLTDVAPSVGTGSWNQNLTNVATNGLGAVINSGSSGSGTNLDIVDLSSGVYEYSAGEVVFNNISGGTDDTVGIAFRSFVSGSPVGASSSDAVGLVVGNINNSGSLDATIRIGGSDSASISDFAAISGTYEFIVRYDLDNDTASFFYDTGSGRTQIGSTITGVTVAATQLGFSDTVTDFGGGDTIAVGSLTLTAVPEPSTYALLAGFLTLGLVLIRRRVQP